MIWYLGFIGVIVHSSNIKIFPLSACPAGMYRSCSDPADSCPPCPANTDHSGVAVAICPCITGYFRAPPHGPNVSCTGKSVRCSLDVTKMCVCI